MKTLQKIVYLPDCSFVAVKRITLIQYMQLGNIFIAEPLTNRLPGQFGINCLDGIYDTFVEPDAKAFFAKIEKAFSFKPMREL